MEVCGQASLWTEQLMMYNSGPQSPPTKCYMSSYRPIHQANAQLPSPAPSQYKDIMFCKTTVCIDEASGMILENNDDIEIIQVARTWQADRRNGRLMVDICRLVR